MKTIDEQTIRKLMFRAVSKDQFLELIKVKSEDLTDEVLEMINCCGIIEWNRTYQIRKIQLKGQE